MSERFHQQISDYRDALRYSDELRNLRHQRNWIGWLAVTGWALFIVEAVLWLTKQ